MLTKGAKVLTYIAANTPVYIIAIPISIIKYFNNSNNFSEDEDISVLKKVVQSILENWPLIAITVPSIFFAAPAPDFNLCTVSSKSPSAFNESSLITALMFFASSVRAAIPSEPCAIKGFNSCADLPNICIESASRSVSLDIHPLFPP